MGLGFENIVLDLTKDLLYNSYSPLWLLFGLGIGAALGYIIGSSGRTGTPKAEKTTAPATSSGGPPAPPMPSAPVGPPSTPPPSSPAGPPSGGPAGPPGKPKKGAPPRPPGGAGASGPGSAGGMGLLTPQLEPCPDLFEDHSGALCKLTGGPLGESRLTGLCKAEWKNCSIRRAMKA